MAEVVPLMEASIGYLLKGKLPPSAVLAPLLSKVLGYTILVFSCIVKVPQILTLLRVKSAEGLSSFSFEMEQIGLAIHTAYGFILGLPISAFGEAAVLLLQNTVLLLLIYQFSRAQLVRPLALTSLFAVAGGYLLSGGITKDIITRAYDLNNVIFIVARVPQIIQNFKARSTGHLSMVTFVANVAGCLIRIFTSIQEGGGITMVRGFVIGLALNLTILLQILYYGRAKSSHKQAAKKKAN
ncbi:hypothetical protein WJX72_011664 [[Myrmecia] bisecta]|uniref:Mannose-P-dolichol utilization defect 1 protein homolog n=1 Tax=[Myrmecia] bisecta TaxID=41462 RepID=A0AAW1PPE7_9CHLO